jgi:hypothetical protein
MLHRSISAVLLAQRPARRCLMPRELADEDESHLCELIGHLRTHHNGPIVVAEAREDGNAGGRMKIQSREQSVGAVLQDCWLAGR